MDKTKIRFYIFTRFKLGLNAREIHKEMCDAWGDSCVSYPTVTEWIRRFKDGRTSLEDDPRVGRPVTEATDRNIAIVRAFIDENPHISIRYIVFETGLSYGNVSRIIHDDLKLKKLCARWIPHELTEQGKEQRVDICRTNLAKLKSGQWRLCDIVTGDETWIYQRGIGTKQSNMSWCAEGESPKTVVKRNQNDQKNMFVIFFRTTGIEFIHMVEFGNSVSAAYYMDNCLEPLFDNLRRRRPKSGLHAIKLHHDNAKPHQAKDTKEFLQQQGVITMPHPSYSPDLAPSDFWLFGYLKQQLGTYSDSKSLKQAVTKTLRNIPQDTFAKVFNQWVERMELCVANQGNYFEHSMH